MPFQSHENEDWLKKTAKGPQTTEQSGEKIAGGPEWW